MNKGLSPNTKTSNAMNGLTTRLLKARAPGNVIDDRTEREVRHKVLLEECGFKMKQSVYNVQTALDKDPSHLDQLMPNVKAEINMVAGVPYLCKLSFAQWFYPMLLKCEY